MIACVEYRFLFYIADLTIQLHEFTKNSKFLQQNITIYWIVLQ